MTQAKRVTPKETSESIGGEKEWGGAALGPGEQFPVRVCGGIQPPLTELVEAYGVGSISIISGHPGDDYDYKKN
jgi:hypothetical protein